MSLFFNKETRAITFEDVFGERFIQNTGDNSALKESAYYSCINYIAKSIAKLPLEILDTTDGNKIANTNHRLYEKLTLRPNNKMSAYTAIETFILLGLHNGMSGMYIDRNTDDLYPVEITNVYIDDAGIIDTEKDYPVLYTCRSGNYIFDCLDRDLIVFRYGYSRDGIEVIPIRSLLAQNVKVLKNGQGYLGQVFENGLVGKLVVQTTSTIEDKRTLKLVQDKFNNMYSSNGRVFTVPAGYNVNSLNLSLADAEFEAIRRLTKKELCSAFSLPSTILNDYEDVNYSTGEQLQLQIYSDALQPIIVQLQQEFTFKYLHPVDRIKNIIEFDEDRLYQMDYETRVNTKTKLADSGIISVNEGRKEFGYTTSNTPGSDEALVQSGRMPLSTAINYYGKGGDENGNKNGK